MGYSTWMSVGVADKGRMSQEDAEKAFVEVCDYIDLDDEKYERCVKDLETAGSDNNGTSLESLVEISRKYPELIFEGSIDGSLEDSSDLSVYRIQNGKMERIFADQTYAPFAEILTEAEAYAARRWPHRDREVGDILSALKTLLKDPKDRTTPALRKANPNHATNKRLLRIAIAALEAIMDAANVPAE